MRVAKGENNAMRKRGDTVVIMLGEFFRRNGYVRRQDAERHEREGAQKYKKGDEIRLVANSEQELLLIRNLLRKMGFNIGQPFSRDTKFRQPVYGREQVARFLEMIGENPSAAVASTGPSNPAPKDGKRRRRPTTKNLAKR